MRSNKKYIMNLTCLIVTGGTKLLDGDFEVPLVFWFWFGFGEERVEEFRVFVLLFWMALFDCSCLLGSTGNPWLGKLYLDNFNLTLDDNLKIVKPRMGKIILQSEDYLDKPRTTSSLKWDVISIQYFRRRAHAIKGRWRKWHFFKPKIKVIGSQLNK